VPRGHSLAFPFLLTCEKIKNPKEDQYLVETNSHIKCISNNQVVVHVIQAESAYLQESLN
jgi:hypothetical protein